MSAPGERHGWSRRAGTDPEVELTFPARRTGKRRIVAHAEGGMSQVVGACVRRDPAGPWIAELDSGQEPVYIRRYTLGMLCDAVCDYLRENGRWWT